MRFRDPIRVISARAISEVGPCLRELEDETQCRGRYAAGFLAYEAAAAFDRALKTAVNSALPLIYFGIYEGFDEIESLDAGDDCAGPAIEWKASIDRDGFNAAIAAIKEYIAAGETYQVNFSYRLRAQLTMDSWNLFRRIAAAQQASFSAFLETDDWALCSASPELLFRLDGARIETRPMKGTAARGLTLAEDRKSAAWLQASIKNRAENIMITDMTRHDLGRIAEVGSVEVEALCALEKYPTLWQMTSTVAAATKASLQEIFAALFPAASITGAPKCRTMGIIDEIESSARGIYTGSVGFIEPNRRAQFNVAIRTVWIDKAKGRAEYGVGGGIVWDSRDDSEFEETRSKSLVLDCMHRMDFDLLETILWRPAGGFFLLERHLQRLAGTAEYFSFRFVEADIRGELERLAKALGDCDQEVGVRLLMAKGGGIRIEHAPIDPDQQPPSELTLAESPIDIANPFVYHKTSNRAFYREFMINGFDDVLLWNEKGELTESTIANILLDIDGEVLTPPISSGLLAGTMRAELLAGGRCRERVLEIEDLKRAERVYLANSVRGMYEVDVLQ